MISLSDLYGKDWEIIYFILVLAMIYWFHEWNGCSVLGLIVLLDRAERLLFTCPWFSSCEYCEAFANILLLCGYKCYVFPFFLWSLSWHYTKHAMPEDSKIDVSNKIKRQDIICLIQRGCEVFISLVAMQLELFQLILKSRTWWFTSYKWHVGLNVPSSVVNSRYIRKFGTTYSAEMS